MDLQSLDSADAVSALISGSPSAVDIERSGALSQLEGVKTLTSIHISQTDVVAAVVISVGLAQLVKILKVRVAVELTVLRDVQLGGLGVNASDVLNARDAVSATISGNPGTGNTSSTSVIVDDTVVEAQRHSLRRAGIADTGSSDGIARKTLVAFNGGVQREELKDGVVIVDQSESLGGSGVVSAGISGSPDTLHLLTAVIVVVVGNTVLEGQRLNGSAIISGSGKAQDLRSDGGIAAQLHSSRNESESGSDIVVGGDALDASDEVSAGISGSPSTLDAHLAAASRGGAIGEGHSDGSASISGIGESQNLRSDVGQSTALQVGIVGEKDERRSNSVSQSDDLQSSEGLASGESGQPSTVDNESSSSTGGSLDISEGDDRNSTTSGSGSSSRGRSSASSARQSNIDGDDNGRNQREREGQARQSLAGSQSDLLAEVSRGSVQRGLSKADVESTDSSTNLKVTSRVGEDSSADNSRIDIGRSDTSANEESLSRIQNSVSVAIQEGLTTDVVDFQSEERQVRVTVHLRHGLNDDGSNARESEVSGSTELIKEDGGFVLSLVSGQSEVEAGNNSSVGTAGIEIDAVGSVQVSSSAQTESIGTLGSEIKATQTLIVDVGAVVNTIVNKESSSLGFTLVGYSPFTSTDSSSDDTATGTTDIRHKQITFSSQHATTH